jgi:enhancer of polycomb-like protein
MHVDPIRPKQRFSRIQNQIDREIQKQKEKDHHWEDQIDVRCLFDRHWPVLTLFQSAYQQFPIPYYHRLFKYVQPPSSPSWSLSLRTPHATADRNSLRSPRALRLRYGRGGRLFVDRRNAAYKHSEFPSAMPTSDQPGGSDSDQEREWRVADRWKHDLDDGPAFGPEGPEEQDRILIDDYHTKYVQETNSDASF